MRSASRIWAASTLKAKCAAAGTDPAKTKGQKRSVQTARDPIIELWLNAPAGSAYVGERAFNHYDHAADVSPAL